MDEPRDYHQHRVLAVRPPAAVRDAAKEALAAHGWTMQDFVTACLAAVGSDPEAILNQIVEHRVTPNRRGRPSKTLEQPVNDIDTSHPQ